MLVEQIDTASSPHPVHPPGCCAIHHQPGRAPIGPSTRVARRPAPAGPTSAQIDTATHHPPRTPLSNPTSNRQRKPSTRRRTHTPNPSPAGTLHGWADGMCPAAAPTALSRGSDGRHVCGLPALSCEIGIPNNGRAAGAAVGRLHMPCLPPDAGAVTSIAPGESSWLRRFMRAPPRPRGVAVPERKRPCRCFFWSGPRRVSVRRRTSASQRRWSSSGDGWKLLRSDAGPAVPGAKALAHCRCWLGMILVWYRLSTDVINDWYITANRPVSPARCRCSY